VPAASIARPVNKNPRLDVFLIALRIIDSP
jgi:hypothetical protein